MSGGLRWLLVTLALAAAIHVAAVTALPYAIMAVVLRRGAAEMGWNTPVHPPLATADARTIVRPSPDLAYSACLFDVRARPLRVSVPLGDGYTSLSMFASNTDNFFAENDRQAGGATIDVVVAGPRTPPFDAAGRRVVRAPSDRGMILVRRVVESPAHFAVVDQLRRGARCVPLD
jgi:uncharacterized membrane protein